MANMKLLFYGSELSETENHELEVFATDVNNILISIDMNLDHEFGKAIICLDKDTAIKFSKELRKQISLV